MAVPGTAVSAWMVLITVVEFIVEGEEDTEEPPATWGSNVNKYVPTKGRFL